MHIDSHFPTTTALPLSIRLDVVAAREALGRHLRDFISTAPLPRPEGERPPALALRVSPGLGKTQTALRVIAEHGPRLLARGNVLFHVPTLELAEEAQAEFAKIAPHLPSAVIRGRSAARPDGEGPMCERHDLASRLAKLTPFVSRALCADEEGNRAPCFDGCPYLAQRTVPGARVLFLSHAYLLLDPPIDREVKVALRVIDEAFWQELARPWAISADQFLTAPARIARQDEFALSLRARSATLLALQQGLPVRAHLSGAGIDAEALERLAKIEARGRDAIQVHPEMPDTQIRQCIQDFDRGAWFASGFRESLFRELGAGESPNCARLTLAKRLPDDPGGQAIRLHPLRELPEDAPILMLDASADPRIIERIVPHARFVRIDAPPRAHVVQATDVVVSNAWLLRHTDADAHRERIARIIRREVARAEGGGVLVVATQSVLRALHADAGRPDLPDEALDLPLHGASPRWFGPRMRGLNKFSTFATAILIGRMQPPVDEVEARGRALFGDDGDPLIPAPDSGLVKTSSERIMARGDPRPATVQTHPDPRFASVLRQMREESSLQAVARLRLMSPDRPKRVVLVGSLPLDDLPVDEITCIDALAAGIDGVESRGDLHAWRRLEAALQAPTGGPISGARLTAAGLAEDLPAGAMTASAAKEFRRGRTSADMHALVHRIARANRWPCTSLELSAPRKGGHPTPAVVFAPARQAVSAATSLWPTRAAAVLQVPEP